jgi:hypothetical protein
MRREDSEGAISMNAVTESGQVRELSACELDMDEVVELANPSGAGAGKLAFALVAVKT